MDISTALSLVIGAFGVTGQLVMLKRPVIGWSISLCLQPFWYALAFTTGAYGLLVLNTGYFIAAILNLRKALRARRVQREQDSVSAAAGERDERRLIAARAAATASSS